MFNKFALIRIAELRCRIPWYKLMIEGRCLYDDFLVEVGRDGNLSRQLGRAVDIMELYGDGLILPGRMPKNVSRRGDPVSLHEIKTNDLRIYFVRDGPGAIVVLGGRKSTQRKDIKRFRRIAFEFHLRRATI